MNTAYALYTLDYLRAFQNSPLHDMDIKVFRKARIVRTVSTGATRPRLIYSVAFAGAYYNLGTHTRRKQGLKDSILILHESAHKK